MKTTQTSFFGPEYEVEITAKKNVKLKFPKDGTPLCEFLILIEPSDEIKTAVRNLKEELRSLMNIPEYVRKAIAHITIHNLLAPQSASNGIVQAVSEALVGFQSFDVELQGAGTFVNGEKRTLFLKVSEPVRIIAIAGAVASKLPGYSSKNPHLTIGRHLNGTEFDKIGDVEKRFSYQGRFACQRVVILRKMVEPETSYKKIAEVKLPGLRGEAE